MLYMFVASIVLIALVLIGYFIYWLKKNSKQEVTKKDLEPFAKVDDLKDIYEEVELIKNIVINLPQARATAESQGNGNGNHQEPSAFDVDWEQLIPLKSSQVAVEEKPVETEEQPKDLPTPEEQKQIINDRMPKARAARKPTK